MGTGIDALSVEKNDEQLLAVMYQSLPPADRMLILDANKYKVRCGHRDSKGKMVYFDLTNESMGSVRFLWMAGDIYYALKRGKVLVIDEMNTSRVIWARERQSSAVASPAVWALRSL